MRTFTIPRIIYSTIVVVILAVVGWYLYEKNVGTENVPVKVEEDTSNRK